MLDVGLMVPFYNCLTISVTFFMFCFRKMEGRNSTVAFRGHPYFGQEEEIVLDMIEQKNVSHRILWLVSNSSKKLMLRKRFPLMALVSPDGTLDEVESGLISCFFQFKLGLH
eukprot:TRINITY_DN2628_c0_g1_i14.p3 TRINITY_DN2628_c0_g1~~TRINITY_DN2628_c0_g1_i14.p3  ORF type:complete len:112 (-),score=25.03 TRINITY_DN2628_c0_g1_i14:1952-2287(-)